MILIRFNTRARDDNERWRVFVGSAEFNVRDIHITGCDVTTAQSREGEMTKHNIAVDGMMSIRNHIAYISPHTA